MAKLTWIGEDDLHGGGAGPSFTTAFGGIKFPKGEPVEVEDAGFIAKARNNPYFEVSDKEAEEDASDDLDTLKIADLRELAEAKDIDHTGMSKSELRDVLRAGDDQDQG